VISEIRLNSNQLTVFPDFLAINNTLSRIFLDDNQIHSVTSNDVKDLNKLYWLTLMNSPLALITDHFIRIDGFQWLSLWDTHPLCCHDMAWLKQTSFTIWTSGATCSHGTSLENMDWKDNTEDQLEGEECPTCEDGCNQCGEWHIGLAIARQR
jgi:hypothetical protein